MQAHNFMQYIFTTLALYNSLYHTLRSFATPQQTWMSTKRGLTLLHSFRHSDVISNRLGCRRHNVIHLLTTLALYYSLYYTLRSSATPQQTWMPTTRGPSSIVHLPLTLALPPRWGASSTDIHNDSNSKLIFEYCIHHDNNWTNPVLSYIWVWHFEHWLCRPGDVCVCLCLFVCVCLCVCACLYIHTIYRSWR